MNGSEPVYLDTSILLAYYREEATSEQVQAFLSSLNEPALLTSLSHVEFASALARWVRMQELTEAQAMKVEAAYQEDLDNGCYQVRPITERYFKQAERWLLMRRTALRSLDALHLAAAQLLKARLLTSDEKLAQSAEELEISCRLITPAVDT